MVSMNCLDSKTRAQIVRCLIEGCSIRATCRMTGAAKNTVVKLLADLGTACQRFHDQYVRNLRVKRIQCDEIWSFVGAKQKNATKEQRYQGWGDIWTWIAIDADTKLVVSYLVGGRDAGWAMEFMEDCASRTLGRLQITTDGHAPYLTAVEGAFGLEVDFAVLIKLYGTPSEEDQRRYSPGKCIGTDMKTILGYPDPDHVSTSYVERQNLTLRMSQRRFTRLTNAFSKKAANHAHAVALHYMHYNFCRVHQSLRVTPAMEAGLTDHVWDVDDMIAMIPKPTVGPSRIDRELFRRALGESA
jgi:IS1 family transposase